MSVTLTMVDYIGTVTKQVKIQIEFLDFLLIIRIQIMRIVIMQLYLKNGTVYLSLLSKSKGEKNRQQNYLYARERICYNIQWD